jgi:hypothetical protein
MRDILVLASGKMVRRLALIVFIKPASRAWRKWRDCCCKQAFHTAAGEGLDLDREDCAGFADTRIGEACVPDRGLAKTMPGLWIGNKVRLPTIRSELKDTDLAPNFQTDSSLNGKAISRQCYLFLAVSHQRSEQVTSARSARSPGGLQHFHFCSLQKPHTQVDFSSTGPPRTGLRPWGGSKSHLQCSSRVNM